MSVSQYVDLWGSVQYADRPENHRKVEIGGKEQLIHSVAVKSSKDGGTVYVSFFDDAFPGFEHPEQGAPIFIHGTLRPGGGEYTNVTAAAYSVFPVTKRKPKQNESF